MQLGRAFLKVYRTGALLFAASAPFAAIAYAMTGQLDLQTGIVLTAFMLLSIGFYFFGRWLEATFYP